MKVVRSRQGIQQNETDQARARNRLENPYLQKKEKRLARLVAEHLSSTESNLLEIGCGEGTNLYFLREALPDGKLIGLDLSPDKARHTSSEIKIPALCGDALALPFPDGCFSAVLCRDVLHHVNWDRNGIVSEAMRVVKPGGTVIIFEASGKTALNRLYALLYPDERGMKDSFAESLLALGKRHGISTLEMVEASMVVRALGFILGPPNGPIGFLLHIPYTIAGIWEGLIEGFWPRRRWAYLMLILKRS